MNTKQTRRKRSHIRSNAARATQTEIVASVRSHLLTSALTFVLVAVMVTTVLLTTGRAVAAQQEVLAGIDSAGTRSIIVKADQSAGIDSSVIDRIAAIDGIAWAGAFSAAEDATNILTGGMKVPVRTVWSRQLDEIGLGSSVELGESAPRLAWGSVLALDQLGLINQVGAVRTGSGREITVMGQFTSPDYLENLEPLLLTPVSEPGPVGTIVVIAATPALVSAVAAAVQSVLDPVDPTKVAVSTSERLATLRGLIDQQLSGFNVSLTVGVFVLVGLLIAALQTGLVVMQRKDYGRRRALGASQRLIVLLILGQVVVLAAAGALGGVLVGAIALGVQGASLPGLSFTTAVALLATAIALVSSLIPGLIASRRDPVSELRVP